MNFFNFLNKQEERDRRITQFAVSYGNGFDYSSAESLQLSTVYRCVEVLSNSIAQLPLDVFILDKKGGKRKNTQLPIYHLLNCEVNARLTKYDWLKLMVQSMLLKGVAYSYIEREGDNIKALHFIPTEWVTIDAPQRLDLPAQYHIQGLNGVIQEKDLVKIFNFTYDGINGYSAIKMCDRVLSTATYAEKTAEQFFENGANVKGILKIEGVSTPKARQNIKEQWNTAFSPNNGGGGGVAVLDGNMTYQPISIDPADSQLLESRKYSVIEICRIFGIPPTLVYDFSNSSYSTSEANNLAFLTTSLQPILSKFENEFRRKLTDNHSITEIKFNTNPLLRADKAGQASYFSTLFNIGVLTVNEIRREMDMEPVKDGDYNYAQVNLTSLENLAKMQMEDQTDNKIKSLQNDISNDNN